MRFVLCAVLLTLAACGPGDPTDGGVAGDDDGGAAGEDAGGAPDAGGAVDEDAGAIGDDDAGGVDDDAGAIDDDAGAAFFDAGVADDAGAVDSGAPPPADAGAPPPGDAGAPPPDGGPPPGDGGPPPGDGGPPPPGDGGPPPPLDGGPPPQGDAGSPPQGDAGSPPQGDAGFTDAGFTDAGFADAGATDGGGFDPFPIVTGPDIDVVACTKDPATDLGLTPSVTITPAAGTSTPVGDGYRHIVSNGVPDHLVGAFPNAGNPAAIAAQSNDWRMRLVPQGAGYAYTVGKFGAALNGVAWDPGANEYYQNSSASGWQYEALTGGIDLGVDCNYAHVQPGGIYHYHGLAAALVDEADGSEMFLVGYAADGYPAYALWAHDDAADGASGLRYLAPSYQLKTGTRPSGPGGTYDGTFVQDWEYVEDLGDLDECNGRTGYTPEHGQTYYYVLTATYPFIPRCFHAQPDMSIGAPPPMP